jgi:hypothetical protein
LFGRASPRTAGRPPVRIRYSPQISWKPAQTGTIHCSFTDSHLVMFVFKTLRDKDFNTGISVDA